MKRAISHFFGPCHSIDLYKSYRISIFKTQNAWPFQKHQGKLFLRHYCYFFSSLCHIWIENIRFDPKLLTYFEISIKACVDLCVFRIYQGLFLPKNSPLVSPVVSQNLNLIKTPFLLLSHAPFCVPVGFYKLSTFLLLLKSFFDLIKLLAARRKEEGIGPIFKRKESSWKFWNTNKST